MIQLKKPLVYFAFVFFFVQTKLFASDPRIDSLTAELKRAKSDSSRAELYLLLASETLAIDFKQSLQNAQQAVYFSKKINSHRLLKSSYKSVASVFFYSGEYGQAIPFFELIAKEAALSGDVFEQLNTQANLALIYSGLGQHQKSISLLEACQPRLDSAYKRVGKEMPLADKISFKLNLANNYDALRDYSNFYPLIDSGIHLAKLDVGQAPILAKLYQLKAKALLYEKKSTEAIALIIKAEELLLKLQDQPALIMLKNLRAKSLEVAGDTITALRIYKEGYQDAVNVGSLILEQLYTEEIYKLYQAGGKTDSAFAYLTLFNAYQKEANASKAKEDLLRKELVDEFQKREAALQEENQSQKSVFIYLAGLGALFLFFFSAGFFIYRKKYKQSSLQKFRLKLDAEKFELEQQRMQAQMLHQEKLLAEYEYKISKNEMLESLVQDLQDFLAKGSKEDIPTATSPENIKEVQQGKIWEEFEIRFLKSHAGFYDRLLTLHSDLTPNERRLCSFLRLDMSTKEISVITGQTVRAVEIARTRLRKKISLTQSDQSLFDYLSAI